MSRSGLSLLSPPLAGLRTDAPAYPALPNDHYAHAGAPFERWRHAGTLRCGARRFGVEVVAARVHGSGRPALLMASIAVTDVAAARLYHHTTWRNWAPGWAESDPDQPWTVAIGAAGEDGALALRAPRHDPLAMSIEAGFVDAATGKPLRLSLRLSQQRAPLLACGGGGDWAGATDGGASPEPSRYAYALTDLKAGGMLQVGAELLTVSGLTWMDHEYGAPPRDGPWLRQQMQLSNGIRIVNEYRIDGEPVANRPAPSRAAVLWPDGNTTVEDGKTTLRMPAWTSPATGIAYFPHVTVEIPSLQAKLEVMSVIAAQELFAADGRSAVYQGVAHAEGVFEGGSSSGTAWHEQRLA